MKKRFLSLLCVLALCMGLLPVTALAAGEIELYVGGQKITESGCYENQNGTWTKVDGTEPANGQFSYDAATATLTLNQAKIVNYQDVTVGGGFTYPGSVIAFSQSADVSLTIVVSQGTSNITGTGGIRVVSKAGDASLSISGPGSLEVKNVSNDSGIVLIGSKNVNLGINSADVTISNVQYYGVQLAAGDACKSTATINDGNLTVSDSVVGIYFMRLYTSGPSSLTVSGNAMVDTEGRTGGIINGFPDSFQIGADGESGGIVFNGNSGTVYGNVTLQEDLEIGKDETLTIGKDASLTVPEETTLTNDGTITVENGGKLKGTINGNQPPMITASPVNQTVEKGSSAAFSVTASASEGEQLTYQWQQKTTESGSEWKDISGAATASYTTEATTTSMNGCQYRCVVTASGVSVISAPATLTVNELITYTITVHRSAGGTATADKTAAAAGETVNLTATPASGYHFDGWSAVPGTVTIQNNQFIMPAENVEIRAVFDRNSSSVGSGGSSYRDREYEFWMDVKEQIRDADPGDTIKVNARSYDRMPWSVMEALREAEDVTLRITWVGGEDIIIPSAAALNKDNGRIYYPLSYLEGLDFSEPAEQTGAGQTGSTVEVEAPASNPAGWQPTAPTEGQTQEQPESEPEESSSQPESEPASEPETEPETEPEAQPDEETMARPESGGLPLALILGGGAAVIAAGLGFWLWKRRSQE